MTDKTAPLKPAATVLLVRDCAKPSDRLEVFMVVRHHQIDFAYGALVFPGGKVDDADMDPALADFLPDHDKKDDPLRPFKVATIRVRIAADNYLLPRYTRTGVLV